MMSGAFADLHLCGPRTPKSAVAWAFISLFGIIYHRAAVEKAGVDEGNSLELLQLEGRLTAFRHSSSMIPSFKTGRPSVCSMNVKTSLVNVLPSGPISYKTLWSLTGRIGCCLGLTVASSMVVASLFNLIPSSSSTDDLAQSLVYTRLIADLFGRPLILWRHVQVSNTVLSNGQLCQSPSEFRCSWNMSYYTVFRGS